MQGEGPSLALPLAGLSHALFTVFERTEDPASLDEAIAAGRQAVLAAPRGRAERAVYQVSLAAALRQRHESTTNPGDLAEAVELFTGVVATVTATPSTRINAAILGSRLIAESDLEGAARLHDTAVRLLPQVVPRQLSQADQQHQLSDYSFLTSDAAALTLRLGQPDSAAKALGLLELGRGVLYGQALDTRGDVAELHRRFPDLAARFLQLRYELDPPDHTVDWAAAAQLNAIASPRRGPDRHRAATELTALLDEIRGRDGFTTFLLPPEPESLTSHAAQGPIVAFNASHYGSDAIVVTTESVSRVPLPALTIDELTTRIDAFDYCLEVMTSPEATGQQRADAEDEISDILEWLWDSAAEPVLRQLGYAGTARTTAVTAVGAEPRVWWIPGGLLGMLPIHAAGYHREASGRTVLDRVVSSYTPTVRALVYARGRASTEPPRRSLIVAMPTTPGPVSQLPNASREAQSLMTRLPEPVLLMKGSAASLGVPTRDTVLTQLVGSAVAHFICHARCDPADPFASELVLHDYADDPLTVTSLARIRLDYAQLAYLSACETFRNTKIELLDEAIWTAPASLEAVTSGKVGAHGIKESASR